MKAQVMLLQDDCCACNVSLLHVWNALAQEYQLDILAPTKPLSYYCEAYQISRLPSVIVWIDEKVEAVFPSAPPYELLSFWLEDKGVDKRDTTHSS